MDKSECIVDTAGRLHVTGMLTVAANRLVLRITHFNRYWNVYAVTGNNMFEVTGFVGLNIIWYQSTREQVARPTIL